MHSKVGNVLKKYRFFDVGPVGKSMKTTVTVLWDTFYYKKEEKKSFNLTKNESKRAFNFLFSFLFTMQIKASLTSMSTN